MDDDKKYTVENENETETETEKNNQRDEFDDFNFTDDFPEEFSADLISKNKDEIDEDDLFSSTFDKKNEFDEFSDFFEKKDAPEDDPFATPTDKNNETDDFFSESFDKKDAAHEDDFSSFNDLPETDYFSATPTDKAPEEEDFFSQDFNHKADEDPYAKEFDEDFLQQKPVTPEEFEADNIAAPPPRKNKGNALKKHPFISLFVIILLIFGGYRLMQRGGEAEIVPAVSSTSVTKSSLEHQVAIKPSTEVKQIDERLDALEQGMLQISEQLQLMQGSHVRLEQMEQMVTQIAEEERNVAATLAQLEALSQQVNALTQLAQKMNELDAEVRVIAGDMALYTTVSEQTQHAANLSRQALQAKSMMPVPMIVQAAIPGRAWLLSEFGELITVARGDEVPGYGRVLNIDPVAGTVTMSSETVFREKK